MAPYDDWNQVDEEEEEELQDASMYETKRDVILFCIDASESMMQLYEDPTYEGVQTSHLLTALSAAVDIQKKKILTGPNDSVGILLFNTTRKLTTDRTQGSELKNDTFLYQPIAPLSAPKVQEVMQLLEAAREDPEELSRTFPPLQGKNVPMGDVFTSCNWVLRDGAPKTASKRVFLITDNDNPHPSYGSQQLTISARTTLIDLVQAGVTIEPFFIETENKKFDSKKFYADVLLPSNTVDEDELQEDTSVLPESISISRIEDLLAQMRFREVPKRAIYSIPFHLANGFTIGVKGYGLVTEQKKGAYRYFADLGDRMEVVETRTKYVDEGTECEVDKTKILYGGDMGAVAGAAADDDESDDAQGGFGTRVVKKGQRPFFTAEEIRKFRTLGLEPGIKLLGFKDKGELAFEDNVKHSQFIYPDEMSYSGSKRTFSALLKSMIKKDKIGIALCLTRRNASPAFCALVPQAENTEKSGWRDPAGFHLIQFPFADDMRTAPIEEGFKASEELTKLALAWIEKLKVRQGGYDYDAFPNPALAYHNEQLQASAFREEYDPESFEDLTQPKVGPMHKRAGQYMKAWKDALENDPTSTYVVPATTGSKRKAEDTTFDISEIKSMYDSGSLAKLRVDQLKEFLKAKGLGVSGKKADLIERVSQWFDAH
ncbi:Ku DNA-binding complex, Ku70 subunit [Agrocybe pediades]|nr:Ku DNA-binding complex, Ku70 subunit [Agrocybe pediades]